VKAPFFQRTVDIIMPMPEKTSKKTPQDNILRERQRRPAKPASLPAAVETAWPIQCRAGDLRSCLFSSPFSASSGKFEPLGPRMIFLGHHERRVHQRIIRKNRILI